MGLEICYSSSQMLNQVPEVLLCIQEIQPEEEGQGMRKQGLPTGFFSSDVVYQIHSTQCPLS